MNSRILVLVVSSCACICLLRSVASGAARFVPINNLSVAAISGDGTIVAGEIGDIPALWTEAGGVESIPLPAGYRLFSVTNLSGDGTTMVGGVQIGTGLNGRYEAFRWTRDAGYQPLGRFSTSYIDWAYATDVSHDGSVVVGTNDTPEGRRAFRWTQATGQTNLGTLGTTNPYYDPFSTASSLSADGSIVVGEVTTSADAYHKPYRWTQSGGFDVIGLPPVSDNGIPAASAGPISGDGSVIAGSGQTGGDSHIWTWTAEGGFVSVPSGPGTDFSNAGVSDISFDGSILVGAQSYWNELVSSEPILYATLWRKTSSGYQVSLVKELLECAGIDMTGWHLEKATEVSYDGRTLVGTGTDPSGVKRFWYAVLPVPEPTSAILLLAACAVIAARRY